MADKNQRKVHEAEVVSPETKEKSGGELVLARQVFPAQLAILPLTVRPVFPRMMFPLVLEAASMQSMIKERQEAKEKYIGLVLAREKDEKGNEARTEPAAANYKGADLYDVGIVAEILQTAQVAPDAPLQVLLSCHERFRISGFVRETPHLVARVEYLAETEMAENDELRAYAGSVVKALKELMQLNPLHQEELKIFMSRSRLNEPGRLADFGAMLTSASGTELQEILGTVSIRVRLRKVFILLKREIEISKIQVKISKQIEDKLTKQQRTFFLQEQLKAIKKELGLAKEGKDAEIDRFTERLKNLKLTDEAAERVREEIDKFKLLEQNSPEFAVSRSYLDWLTLLPWGLFTKDSYDLVRARRVLDRDHYGLKDVKERILEFLSVGILKGNISGTILCFVGPPGVGKTSLGHSIAKSIGRNFYRFSLGGMRDEAEIKGHRRTYIGAMPGKFLQALKVCKSANPVIMLDEVDKIGTSFHGDPASALLEVLDPEQNRDFLDHYLDVRFDLSNIFFICTANVLDTIPRPLLDRMEIIQLSGYILEEKLGIAQRHLLPKQMEAHGVKKGQISITPAAIRAVIDGYAREPGVRSLENNIKKMIRKSVQRIVEKKARKITIDKSDVGKLLGRKLFTGDMPGQRMPGVVTGLAWTSMGGETITIEATRVETGKEGFKQTGQLGSVMVESSEIAYTHIRSLMSRQEKTKKFFANNFVHLHVPAGATPKDGPSAGITMAAALYSLAIGKPIQKGIVMTGELTLTGRVMPIGGVKEKTIAAKRSGFKEVIFPAENRRDFEELPAHIRKGLKTHFISEFSGLIKICFPGLNL